MHRTKSLLTGVALAGVVLLSAACGSSSPASTTTSTSASLPTASTEAASGAGADAAITKAFETLFDLSNPALAPKLAVIEGSTALDATLRSTLKSPLAKLAGGAKVLKISAVPSSTCTSEALTVPCEAVKFNIVSPKGGTLTGDNGFAVYVSGRWPVAKQTICGLLALASGGKVPAGC
jgi:hypothetical protein